MDIIVFRIAAFFYMVSAVLYVYFLFRSRPGISRQAYLFLLLAFVIHTAAFLIRGVLAGHFPVTDIFESLSIFSWMLVGGYLLLEWRYNVPILGSFVSPLNCLVLLAASLEIRSIRPLSPVLKSGWLYIHVVSSFLGEAAFALAFVVSTVYLLQEGRIRKKQLGGLFLRLPDLNQLDELNYRLLTMGFPLLSLGIITGALWAQYAWGSYWSWDPKETWSLITWLIYAAILHGRMTVGWRGRRAAVLSVIGFGAVMFTFLGVNLLLPGLHSYSSM
jgi:cytochrome c-type biogenesis protein CcsB